MKPEWKTWFPDLGDQIGSGVDGQVFLLGGDRVIKFSGSYDHRLLAEIASGYYMHYVVVDDFGVLPDGTHFTIMERLYPLTTDEEKVFHTIISHEDQAKVKLL